MDLLIEMERMCANATADSHEDDIKENDVKRWQRLFHLDHETAHQNICQYRADVGRERISDELWEDVAQQKRSQGFDKEAYEYDLFCRPKSEQTQAIARSATTSTDLRGMILSGPLDTPEKVREIAGLTSAPAMVSAESETDMTGLCYISHEQEQKIRQGLSERRIDFKPFFVNINLAAKQLSTISAAPTLGLDSTLPQNRADNGTKFDPQPDQYPVWYFFYGTLADPEILRRVLALSEPPDLVPARISGGVVKHWGKYRALVDSSLPEAYVEGHALLVTSEEQERELRIYETNVYEVVRCDISISSGPSVKGLTFRFTTSLP